MPKDTEKEKVKHEIAMEHAKEMFDKGIGMAEIVDTTNLNHKDINKARRKLEDED